MADNQNIVEAAEVRATMFVIPAKAGIQQPLDNAIMFRECDR